MNKKTDLQLAEDIKRGKPAVKRSPQWGSVRKKHLKNNPVCAACGAKIGVQVHHIRPFHLFPELELEPSNLITLCETFIDNGDITDDNHHLHLGHKGDFHKNNKKVLETVDAYRQKKAKLPKLEGYDFQSLKKIL